ncbi:hypothetical protein [Mycobacterium talmoniae]|uniref:Uncharacterized protein n=1 Tax=Mycobacterium talmoniae TaxID=1858794 RepID=A0A1S1NFV0_9MYCO|nr:MULTISPECIES: hypothetical protein [Mycobacterium]OHV04559.1 hypothetical protein BKN37_09340 [Mycobacterium talmoniae]PQM46402.1 hypothetical protein C1Y40_03434 [Mycobacterium talmoniae]TDH52896.1 hypothetical protein E2F47_13615 [Mycobacterium eburneum]
MRAGALAAVIALVITGCSHPHAPSASTLGAAPPPSPVTLAPPHGGTGPGTEGLPAGCSCLATADSGVACYVATRDHPTGFVVSADLAWTFG